MRLFKIPSAWCSLGKPSSVNLCYKAERYTQLDFISGTTSTIWVTLDILSFLNCRMGTVTPKLSTSIDYGWPVFCDLPSTRQSRRQSCPTRALGWGSAFPLPRVHQSISYWLSFFHVWRHIYKPNCPRAEEKVMQSISHRILISFHSLASSFPGTAHSSHREEQFTPWELFILYSFRFSALQNEYYSEYFPKNHALQTSSHQFHYANNNLDRNTFIYSFLFWLII